MFKCFFAAVQFSASSIVRPSFGLKTVKTRKLVPLHCALIDPSAWRVAPDTFLHAGWFSLMILVATAWASPLGAAPTLIPAASTEDGANTRLTSIARATKVFCILDFEFGI
jgi:hypothetical protein